MQVLDSILQFIASEISTLKSSKAELATHSTTASVALPASDSVNVTVNMTYSGYTLVGIAGVRTSGSGSSLGFLSNFYFGGSNAYVTFRNTTSTARNYTVEVTGLYTKN